MKHIYRPVIDINDLEQALQEKYDDLDFEKELCLPYIFSDDYLPETYMPLYMNLEWYYPSDWEVKDHSNIQRKEVLRRAIEYLKEFFPKEQIVLMYVS